MLILVYLKLNSKKLRFIAKLKYDCQITESSVLELELGKNTHRNF